MFTFVFLNPTGTGADMEKANLTSQITGSTDVFTIPASDTSTIRVYYNGIRQVEGENFTVNNSNETLWVRNDLIKVDILLVSSNYLFYKFIMKCS